MADCKPCPWCGSTEIVYERAAGICWCARCRACGPQPEEQPKTEEEAREAWNRRAGDD